MTPTRWPWTPGPPRRSGPGGNLPRGNRRQRQRIQEATMAVCPNGHDSASEDFCDICGMRIDGARVNIGPSGPTGMPAYGSPPAPAGGGGPGGPRPDPAGQPCPQCGTARSGQFCESCGFNFGTAQQPAQPAWPPPPASQPPYPPPPSAGQPPYPPPPSAGQPPYPPPPSA